MPFEQFPYTNFHELNLDWIIGQLKKLEDHKLINTAYVRSFETVNDLKNADYLEDGMIVATEGYYELNDGGNASYLITENGVANELNVIACKDNLKAVLITNKRVNIKQFGAHGDGSSDDTLAIQKAVEYAENEQLYEIYIPEGTYTINGIIVINSYVSLVGTANSILKAGPLATNCLIKYTFQDTINRPIVIDSIRLDGNNTAVNGILMTKQSGSTYLRNCIFYNIFEYGFTGHGFKFDCTFDSALYASVFYKCIFDSGISLNKFGDTVTIDGCSFGRLSDNEFIQYTNASTFAFTNNNVTGYCNFDIQLHSDFSNNIFELQVEPVKNFITIKHAIQNLVMHNCVFSNQHLISDPSAIKLIKFEDRYIEFINCLFTANNAPACYDAPYSLITRFYGCMVSNGLANKDTVLANFNHRLFDVCQGTYGTVGGFDVLSCNALTSYTGISLNNYIRMEAVNALPGTPADNTLYIVRSEKKLCLSLTGGVVYEVAMTLRS